MVQTKIEWCDYTYNPWRGCSKVSPGCANCYADAMSKRNPGTLGVWGPDGTRVVAAESYWQLPLKWNRVAAGAAIRPRVFCASLADVFEDWCGDIHDHRGNRLWIDRATGTNWQAESLDCSFACDELARLDDVRRRLFSLIEATQNLDWLLLTKRPENIQRMLPGLHRRDNLWAGCSVENQETTKRIDKLVNCRDLAALLFLSCEPLLSAVDLLPFFGGPYVELPRDVVHENYNFGIDWVIVGGESGPNARPCDVEWIRFIVKQCREAGVPCFVKQLGSHPIENGKPIKLRDRKGGNPDEWPDDLRVREFPKQEAIANND
ncbi:MAG TPA: DUF5131 family protein [Pirellulaceae bacterium]|nr:DUF5131 family protein [Pirellulaceae bacterium]